MWLGDKVYFLSDRDGPITLFAYDTKAKKVTQVIENAGLDIKSASASPDAIVYEQFGSLTSTTLKSGKTRKRRRHDQRRHARGAPEVREGRNPHDQRRDLADRRARGLRSARRDHHACPPRKATCAT